MGAPPTNNYALNCGATTVARLTGALIDVESLLHLAVAIWRRVVVDRGAARRNGLAPHRITSRLGYAYKKFKGSLGGVFTDERPDGVYGRFREAVLQFDTSLNWKLTRRATLYVQGRNITGEPLRWFDTSTGVAERRQRILRQYQEYGANWNFGVKGTF